MFRMTPHGQRLSNDGLTDSHLPLDVPGGSLNPGYLRRVRMSHNPRTRVKVPPPPVVFVFLCFKQKTGEDQTLHGASAQLSLVSSSISGGLAKA